jgi:hypothetical protein
MMLVHTGFKQDTSSEQASYQAESMWESGFLYALFL